MKDGMAPVGWSGGLHSSWRPVVGLQRAAGGWRRQTRPPWPWKAVPRHPDGLMAGGLVPWGKPGLIGPTAAARWMHFTDRAKSGEYHACHAHDSLRVAGAVPQRCRDKQDPAIDVP